MFDPTLFQRKDVAMKQKTLSRLPHLVRSIFLPRKSAVVTAQVASINRIAALASEPSMEVVLRQVIDVESLIGTLRVPGAEAARDAALTLGQSGSFAAVEPLIEVLTNAQGFFHPLVRAAAATSLGKLKDARAVDALIAATGDSTAEISEEAALALGCIGDKKAVQPLLNIVANRACFFLHPVRRAAVKALGEFRTAEVSSVLLAVSINDAEDDDVRQAARDVKLPR
ncbi:hypothetical protein BH10PLA1_BH10PLA1_12440 [soil metagenome]